MATYIDITTYEIDQHENSEPSLMHRFYGKTLKDALGTAKAHLITDSFFSGSFVGELQWHDFVLRLENEIDIPHASDSKMNTVYDELYVRAFEVQRQKKKIGLIGLMQQIK